MWLQKVALTVILLAACGAMGTISQAAEPVKSNTAILEELLRRHEQQPVSRRPVLSVQLRGDEESQPYSVSDDNFVVSAVGKSLAESLLNRADELRRDLALKHLRKLLPDKSEFTIIQIEIDATADEECEVWLCGKGRAIRGAHRVWITAATTERVVELLEKSIELIIGGGKPRVTERK